MKIKRLEIDKYDYGSCWESEINKKIFGATHIHTVDFSDTRILVYAFFKKEKSDE